MHKNKEGSKILRFELISVLARMKRKRTAGSNGIVMEILTATENYRNNK